MRYSALGSLPDLRLLAARGEEQPLVLADGPAVMRDQPHLLVDLALQGDVVPAGLFGELTARGGRAGLAGIQAPAGRGPVPPGRWILVIAQQQYPVIGVEHNNPAGPP